MICEIISAVINCLAESGVSPVYSAFDAIPVSRKDSGIYTVVGVRSYECMTPVYSLYTVYMPFKAEVEIKVTAPKNTPASQLGSYFAGKVMPAAAELAGLRCRLSRAAVSYDSNINRLVLTAVLSVSGMTKIERSELQQ